MSPSHLQTRTLSDALDRLDAVLASRGTRLVDTKERRDLAACFAPTPAPYFKSWAFSAAEYAQAVQLVRKEAPGLAGRLEEPRSDRDFTIVGHCSLDLRFQVDINGAQSTKHALQDGTPVEGASVTAERALLFSSGLVGLPTKGGRYVYLLQPRGAREGSAARLAASAFEGRGEVEREGLTVVFPAARTEILQDYGWVTRLLSENRLYAVRNFVSSGAAVLDEDGFFARETHVIQALYLCRPRSRTRVVIDGPFLAFFAEDGGVHAAAWFDRDSFTRP